MFAIPSYLALAEGRYRPAVAQGPQLESAIKLSEGATGLAVREVSFALCCDQPSCPACRTAATRRRSESSWPAYSALLSPSISRRAAPAPSPACDPCPRIRSQRSTTRCKDVPEP